MSKYIKNRTGVDHPNTGTTRARASKTPVLQIWHLHVGTVKLYIVGPGPDAFLAASESYYRGRVGSDDERNLARKAVQLLACRHRDDMAAGPVEIAQALADARAGIRPEAIPAAPEPETITSLPPQRRLTKSNAPHIPLKQPRHLRHGQDADPQHIARIVRAVCAACRVPVCEIRDDCRAEDIVIARHIIIHLIAEAYPDLRVDIIGTIVARSGNNVSAILRGVGNVKSVPEYPAIIQAVATALAAVAA